VPSDCITATIDGAARGNPGPAAYGVVFEDANGKILAQLSARLGKATNNVAEYRALLAALAYAREQGWRALKVRTDSELLANQVRGRFKVKNPDLKLLHAEAHRLAGPFDFFSIEAVPRARTRPADKLANAALDGRSAISRQPSVKAVSTSGGHGFSKTLSGAEGSRAVTGTKKEGAFRSKAKRSGDPERSPHSGAEPKGAPEGTQTIRAVYRDGVLKPLEPLDLPDATEVELQIRPSTKR